MESSNPLLIPGNCLMDLVFSWSLEDVLNADLYKNKVNEIPTQFSSASQYLESFIYPLIEETHAELYSSITELPQAPSTEILSLEETKDFEPSKNISYKILLNESNSGVTYKLGVGDLFAITDVKPKFIDDLKRPGRPFVLASVQARDFSELIIRSSRAFGFEQQEGGNSNRGKLFATLLINMITNVRIWRALISSNSENLNIIKKVLQTQSQEPCDHFYPNDNSYEVKHAKDILKPFNLNLSQEAAVLSCISIRECTYNSHLQLIWGPPGTGKTKTVGSLLFVLFKMKCRTVTCAPTNIAVLEVTSRLLKLVSESIEYDTYGLGDIILFGNEERMKITDHRELTDIFLDRRAEMLLECFAPFSGWRHSLRSMINLLENPANQYHEYLADFKLNKKGKQKLTFKEFLIKTIKIYAGQLKFCMKVSYTHLPTTFISSAVVKEMEKARHCLNSISFLMEGYKISDKEVRRLMGDCRQVLNSLSSSFTPPDIFNKQATLHSIKKFCLRNACLIFCTASSSVRLQTSGMAPIEFLVIDEAGQLKESESAIPLQISGLCHAVLIGDEKQLPAMVKSKISEKAGFARSLFERQVALGHKRHLLNTQYRMHPSISLFPKTEFYDNQILDAPNVKHESYEKNFLPGKMYGAFSFIDVQYGREELGDNHSSKNLVEVAVVSDLVERLFKESIMKRQKISVGVISPYNAQVSTLQKKLGRKYSKEKESGFSLSVRSVDGYQGGEDDVIIISTVRCNRSGSIGFLGNRQRTNVALTRARYHLWVLGSGSTLLKSGTVWDKLVTNAKQRDCFFNANDDMSLARVIILALLTLNQIDDLLNAGSKLFTKMRWKVFYSYEFWISMTKVQGTESQNKVLLLLENLSVGWRQPSNERKPNYVKDFSSQMLRVYHVYGVYNLVWSVDTINENSIYHQVLKIWDISPFSKLQKITRRLDKILTEYSAREIHYCNAKLMEGNLEIPVSWQEDKHVSWQEDKHEEQLLSNELASVRLLDQEPDTLILANRASSLSLSPMASQGIIANPSDDILFVSSKTVSAVPKSTRGNNPHGLRTWAYQRISRASNGTESDINDGALAKLANSVLQYPKVNSDRHSRVSDIVPEFFNSSEGNKCNGILARAYNIVSKFNQAISYLINATKKLIKCT